MQAYHRFKKKQRENVENLPSSRKPARHMHRGCYGSNLGPTPRHNKIITMHSQDFSNKGRAIKGLVVCYLT